MDSNLQSKIYNTIITIGDIVLSDSWRVQINLLLLGLIEIYRGFNFLVSV